MSPHEPRRRTEHAVGIWVYRRQDTPDGRVENCWRRNAPSTDEPSFDSYGCPHTDFASGSRIRSTYEVWDDYTTEGYLTPGTYRFETTVEVSGPTGADIVSTDWWFDLRISDDG